MQRYLRQYAGAQGMVLYQELLSESKDNPIFVDNFPVGKSQNLYVGIYCPASWTEGDVNVKVNWSFSSKKAIPDPTKRPSGGGGSVIIVTNTPVVTEEPVMETDTPEPTKVPEDTPLPTAVLEVTDTPMVTQTPSEKPKEPDMVVTEAPEWEEVEEETTEPATPEPTNKATEVPSSTPKATDGVQPLKSEEPDNVDPVETLEEDPTSDERPRRTSTPKLPTTVEEVYPTKTGDATPIVVWLVLFVVSLVGTISAFTAYRKRE